MSGEKLKEEAVGEENSFFSHLTELRTRIIRCVLVAAAVFLGCYRFSAVFLQIVQHPLKDAMPAGSSLSLLSLTEGFMVEFKVSALAAIVLSSPFWFYQIWKFVAPALHANEKRYVWTFVPMATFFFALGGCFNYFVTLPFALKFLLNYAGPAAQLEVPVTAHLSLESYTSFFINTMLAFGIVFELPVLTLLLARMGVLHYKMLTKSRRFAVLVIFILAAFLTPSPDAFNMCLMALPLWILYELSIVLVYLFGPKPPPEEKDEDDDEPAPGGAGT